MIFSIYICYTNYKSNIYLDERFTLHMYDWDNVFSTFLMKSIRATESCAKYLKMFFRTNRQENYITSAKESIFLSLKLVSAIFYQVFIFFIKWQTFKNYEKCFLFPLKSSFRSRDIQIFVTFSLTFHTFQIQKDKGKWNNLWCHNLGCIDLQI